MSNPRKTTASGSSGFIKRSQCSSNLFCFQCLVALGGSCFLLDHQLPSPWLRWSTLPCYLACCTGNRGAQSNDSPHVLYRDRFLQQCKTVQGALQIYPMPSGTVSSLSIAIHKKNINNNNKNKIICCSTKHGTGTKNF